MGSQKAVSWFFPFLPSDFPLSLFAERQKVESFPGDVKFVAQKTDHFQGLSQRVQCAQPILLLLLLILVRHSIAAVLLLLSDQLLDLAQKVLKTHVKMTKMLQPT